MQLQIFSIYDQAAKAYITPFFLPNEEMALRAFSNCVNDPDHQFHKVPTDYSLWAIGFFDGDDGEISPHTPNLVARAQSIIKPSGIDPDDNPGGTA